MGTEERWLKPDQRPHEPLAGRVRLCEQFSATLRATFLREDSVIFFTWFLPPPQFQALAHATWVYAQTCACAYILTHTYQILQPKTSEKMILVKTQISLVSIKKYFNLSIFYGSPTTPASVYYNLVSVLNSPVKMCYQRLPLTSRILNPMVSAASSYLASLSYVGDYVP